MASKSTKQTKSTDRSGSSGRSGSTRQGSGKRTSTAKSGGAQKSTTVKKSSAARKTTASKRATTEKSTKKAPVKQPRPIRREVGALIFLLLAVFAAFGYFKSAGGVLIEGYCGILKGLLGYGFYVTPPALLLVSGILMFHRGRPVCARSICALLLPFLSGGVLHVLLCKGEYALDAKAFAALWASGRELASGGALSGWVAVLLTTGFNQVGAVILYVLALSACLMAVTRCTPADIADKAKSGAARAKERAANRPVYEPEETYDDEENLAEEPPRRQERRRRKGFDVDIALNGEKRADPLESGEEEMFDATPGVRPPHEYLKEELREEDKRPKRRREKAEPAPAPQDYDFDFRDLTEEQPREAVPLKDPVFELTPEAEQQPEPVEESVPAEETAFEPEDDETDEDKTFEETYDMDEPEEEVIPVAPARPTMSASAVAVAEALAHDRPQPAPQKTEERSPQPPVQKPAAPAGEEGTYQYPPVYLLNEPSAGAGEDGRSELETTRELLDDTIKSFGIDARIVNVTRGPSVTRYELELSRGVKLSKLTNLAGDIALSLGAASVRIAPITGRNSVVGVEVPNQLVTPVPIREVIDSREFRTHPSRVAFAVGKDISGKNIVGNIAKLPHMLIAGTTGSGKSVCTNSLIISLLYKSSPEDVRLIMVDPKMVELGIYNGIPHLLIPVVTDPKKAAGALQWAVTEMMKRYRLFSEAGVRELSAYNAHMLQSGQPEQKLPQIVVVIDELADLMLVAAKEVEESICRVAQMGRAAGMHLVIATQRPSADVITGLMKANIPSRIAFAVASSMESRIILDTTGAEKLVGKGDMLYAPLGIGKPQRVQGCMITDEEVAKVVEFIKQNSTANYDDSVMEEVESNAQKAEKSGKGKGNNEPAPANAPSVEGSAEEADELLNAAIDIVVETGMASVSMLQRRLKLGYARAARLVDQMEERGVVGAYQGSKPREVKISREEWQQIKLAQDPDFAAATDEEYAQALAMSQAADAEAETSREEEFAATEGDEAPF